MICAKQQSLDKLTRSQQVYSLISVLGPRIQKIIEKHLKINIEDPDITCEILLDRFQAHLRSKRNVALDRVAFSERKQHSGETIEEFRVALEELADDAEICGHCREEQITTRIIAGVRSTYCREKLLQMSPFPSLEEAMKLCLSKDTAEENEMELRGTRSNYINRRSKSNYRSQEERARSPSPGETSDEDAAEKCSYCGEAPHKKRRDCKAYGHKCSKCNRFNHFSSLCLTRSRSQPSARNNSVRVQQVSSSATCQLDTINLTVEGFGIKGLIRGALPDSGSAASMMPLKELKQLGKLKLLPCKEKVIAANGKQIKTAGKVKFKVHYQGARAGITFIVSPQVNSTLLSKQACMTLGILPKNFPARIKPFMDGDDVIKDAPPSKPWEHTSAVSITRGTVKKKPEVAVGDKSREPGTATRKPPDKVPPPWRSNRARKKPAKLLD
jgi:hypothetical protein